MTFLRNLPVMFWWIAIILVLADFPAVVFCLALPLLLAAPFHKLLVDKPDDSMLPVSSLGKFSALMSLTTLGMVKAAVYDRKLPSVKMGKLLSRVIKKEGKS